MQSEPVLIYHAPERSRVPDAVRAFAAEGGLSVMRPDTAEDLAVRVNRSYPACIVLDLDGGADPIQLCRRLKRDAFTAVVPVIFHAARATASGVRAALDAGADEVLNDRMSAAEQRLRFRMTLQRASRDVSVHPTTRLPGTVQIARDIGERMRRSERFAVCYADLDHFKEFNDRYGYNEGDRVIYLVSRILRDIVKAHSSDGFIGHIGGDDFIFNLPLDAMPCCCEDIIEVFDELIPFQYSAEDREAGSFLGKDRRGNVYEVPIMTLSIGVVTNLRRNFTHPGRVSELATEMKSYAKTLTGSVYAVDRRSDDPPAPAVATADRTVDQQVPDDGFG